VTKVLTDGTTKRGTMADVLLVVDVQQGLVEALPPERRTSFVDTLKNLIARARSRGTQLVYVRHGDEGLQEQTPAWHIADAIAPRDGEPIVDKHKSDAFEETDLADVLAARDLDHLIVCGMQSDFCVNATARGGVRRDYRVTVISDAHATYAGEGRSETEICNDVNRDLQAEGIGLVCAAHVF
jgi:nicotinamidase-related amidase